MKLTPFVGIASSYISPVEVDLEEHPNLDEYDLEFTTTYTLGLTMDIKFGNANGFLLANAMEKSNFIIRLRYAYCLPQFSGKYPGFEGNVHSLTLGIGTFSRRHVRDK